MARDIPGPYDAAEMRSFLESFMYREQAFFVDEVIAMDREERRIEALMHTTRTLPLAASQRSDERHPAHVAAGELLMITGSLGCLHAWFFHGCRWNEGWAGFGSRIHRADFKSIARIGEPLRLESREVRSRLGPRRLVLRCEFRFRQGGNLVYVGDQSAMFFKDRELGEAREEV